MAEAIIPGIYVIRNNISGKVYVGSSINPKKRWREHRCNLRQGKHHAPLLQRAWDARGESAFTFEVIETVHTKAEMVCREQYWIDTLESFGSKGYNATGEAFRMSAENIAKGVAAASAKRRGNPHSPESNLRRSLSQKGIPKGHGAKISATKKALGQKPSAEAASMGGKATCLLRWGQRAD